MNVFLVLIRVRSNIPWRLQFPIRPSTPIHAVDHFWSLFTRLCNLLIGVDAEDVLVAPTATNMNNKNVSFINSFDILSVYFEYLLASPFESKKVSMSNLRQNQVLLTVG